MEGPPVDLLIVADAPFSVAWIVFIHAGKTVLSAFIGDAKE